MKNIGKIIIPIMAFIVSMASYSNVANNQPIYMKKIMAHLDVNNDHKISLSEFTKMNNQRFNKADNNKDGAIDRQEAKHPKAKKMFKYAETFA